MTLEVGDRVRTRKDTRHVFPVFERGTAEVLEVRPMGSPRRPWAHLRFEESTRTTWLPIDRLAKAEP